MVQSALPSAWADWADKSLKQLEDKVLLRHLHRLHPTQDPTQVNDVVCCFLRCASHCMIGARLPLGDRHGKDEILKASLRINYCLHADFCGVLARILLRLLCFDCHTPQLKDAQEK